MAQQHNGHFLLCSGALVAAPIVPAAVEQIIVLPQWRVETEGSAVVRRAEHQLPTAAQHVAEGGVRGAASGEPVDAVGQGRVGEHHGKAGGAGGGGRRVWH